MSKPKALLSLLILLLIPCWGIAWKPGGDLGVYYQASEWIQKGWVDRLYSNNAEIGNFFYGPFGLALLKPLALLTFKQANFLWLFLQTIAYVTFWHFIFKFFPELMEPKRIGLLLLTWIVSIKPIHASFQSHNVQLMFAALLLVAEWGSETSKPATKIFSGILVSLIASIKIYPAFIGVYFLIRKSNWVRLGLFLGGLLSLLFPIWVFGFHIGSTLPLEFVRNALDYHKVYDLSKDVVSLSLPSLLTTWLPKAWISRGAVSLVVGFLAIGYLGWTLQHRSSRAPKLERYFLAFSWAMMAMLNSTTRPDYFIFFVPAFVSIPLLTQTTPSRKLYLSGIFISVCLIAFITEWTLGSRELTHYLESLRIPVLGILLLCLMQFTALRNNLNK